MAHGERRHLYLGVSGRRRCGPRLARSNEILAGRSESDEGGCIELLHQPTPVTAQDRAGDAREQGALGVRHAIAAQQIGSAWTVLPGPPGSVVEDGRELRV